MYARTWVENKKATIFFSFFERVRKNNRDKNGCSPRNGRVMFCEWGIKWGDACVRVGKWDFFFSRLCWCLEQLFYYKKFSFFSCMFFFPSSSSSSCVRNADIEEIKLWGLKSCSKFCSDFWLFLTISSATSFKLKHKL